MTAGGTLSGLFYSDTTAMVMLYIGLTALSMLPAKYLFRRKCFTLDHTTALN
jgi:hypothetical protein